MIKFLVIAFALAQTYEDDEALLGPESGLFPPKLEGACPQFKPFDFEPEKLLGKPFKLVYANGDDFEGIYCSEQIFESYKENVYRFKNG